MNIVEVKRLRAANVVVPGFVVVWLDPDPKCDVCRVEGRETINVAVVDGKTVNGPWALMCDVHYISHGVGLGVGRGQVLLSCKVDSAPQPTVYFMVVDERGCPTSTTGGRRLKVDDPYAEAFASYEVARSKLQLGDRVIDVITRADSHWEKAPRGPWVIHQADGRYWTLGCLWTRHLDTYGVRSFESKEDAEAFAVANGLGNSAVAAQRTR